MELTLLQHPRVEEFRKAIKSEQRNTISEWTVTILLLLFGDRVVPSRRSPRWPGGPSRESKPGGELVRDPHCGTYVPKARALAASVGSETAYFCSTTCRDAYLAKARA